MRSFNGIPAFVNFLAELPALTNHHVNAKLKEAAELVEKTAKEAIGTYTLGWPPLQPETVARKAGGDTPLLETGELRDSIHHSVGHLEAVIGTNDKVGLYQELGTARGIPPRSFLAASVIKERKEIAKLIGGGFISGLSGKSIS